MRLNTFLAHAGLTSRRGAADFLRDHNVCINGARATEPGIAVDELQDRVTVDRRPVTLEVRLRYFLLNKPRGIVCTVSDPEGRPTVLACLPPLRERIYPVGRLDRDTTGVLLLTNDGDLAFRLTHPRFKVVKIYEARVDGRFTEEAMAQLKRGVRLPGGSLGKAEASIVARNERGSVLRLRLIEGKKHEVKDLCAAVGFPVRQLKRVQFADLDVSGMPQGAWRELQKVEVRHLKGRVIDPEGPGRVDVSVSPTSTAASRSALPTKRMASKRTAERRQRN